MSGTAAFGNASADAGRNRWWFVAVGVLLLVLGLVGLSMTVAFTIASTLWFGVLLLVAGLGEIAEALARPKEAEIWRSRAVRVLAGLLYLLGGLYAIVRPLEASLALTLVLGATLIASGIARSIWAVAHEVQTSRAAVILFAVLSVLLGAALIAQWPYSGLWAIGLFVSCDLIAAGATWCWVGLSGRAQATPAVPPPHLGATA
ncbi:conserved hypothetical protein [Methylobacterium sp. 4-46]|uniref:HdeD family acid-resistance protein n=1 Tax=unclassified Methylobacterium TaxID=2615210 RepID=UPI000152C54B|nr:MULTISPECIES: DUF308 domain-containing protein [Methylobacterium]ACA15351.1 conserved hypothetical protein [Methylobacterium sp. 4-46]WFT81074.1 DUF308 domain-containing protein [Methylobacterium nodulans]